MGFEDALGERAVATQQGIHLADFFENAKCLNRDASRRIRGSLRDCACAPMRRIARASIAERPGFRKYGLTRGYREYRRTAGAEQRPHCRLRLTTAIARACRKADGHVDGNDNRILRQMNQISKMLNYANSYLRSGRPHQRDEPAFRAAIHTREPGMHDRLLILTSRQQTGMGGDELIARCL